MALKPLRERFPALPDSRDPLRGTIRFTKYSFVHVILYESCGTNAFIGYIAKFTYRAELLI